MSAPAQDELAAADAADEATDAAFEGSGVVSSWYDLGEAVQEQDAAGVAWAAAGAGLDTLGFVADPLGELAGAGVGWAIEHCWFLREPLDALAGDPQEISAAAGDWERVATELTAAAGAVRDGAAATGDSWAGEAADGYRTRAAEAAGTADRIGAEALRIADLVLQTGAVVGTQRALIRDTLADFVAGVISMAVVTAVSGGAAAPATLAAVAADAGALGLRLADRLDEIADMLRRASEIAERTERVLGAALPRLAEQVEYGKQSAAARAASPAAP